MSRHTFKNAILSNKTASFCQLSRVDPVYVYYKLNIITLIVVAVCLLGCDNMRESRNYTARLGVRLIDEGIKAYFSENGFAPYVAPQTSPENANRIVMKALMERNTVGEHSGNGPYLNVRPENLDANGAFLDPWGIPYHILLKQQTDAEINVGRYRLKQRWAVWSSGENRINEWGDGDDICSWKDK